MFKGIYIALSGAVLKERQIEMISQNLANANTTGYKKDRIAFQDYMISQKRGMGEALESRTMSTLSSIMTDFSSGAFIKTGNRLDIALEGEGFITLEGERYTKRGDLKIDDEGYLITQSSMKVLGEGGPIQVPQGRIEISPSGDIVVDGIQVDTLKITHFEDINALIKTGEEVFSSGQQGIEGSTTVQQGFLEGSNVSVIKEAVQMISTMREFETYKKTIQTFDEVITRVTSEMGKIQ